MNKDHIDTIKENVNLHYKTQWDGYSNEDVMRRVSNLRFVLDSIIANLPYKSPIKVLDFGCGPAVLSLRLAEVKKGEFHCDIYGIDLSYSAIRLGQRLVKRNEIDFIHLLVAECETLPFAKNSFDAILSNVTFNLLTDKNYGFSEMVRVLKEDGIIVIGDCIAKDEGKSCSDVKRSSGLWSQCVDGAPTIYEIRNLAQTNGFNIIETQNLSETVYELVTTELWDWPEFLENDLEYQVFTFKKK